MRHDWVELLGAATRKSVLPHMPGEGELYDGPVTMYVVNLKGLSVPFNIYMYNVFQEEISIV